MGLCRDRLHNLLHQGIEGLSEPTALQLHFQTIVSRDFLLGQLPYPGAAVVFVPVGKEL